VRLIPELADFAARRHADAPFLLRFTPTGWQGATFRQAATAMHAYSAWLIAEGVRPGDRVAIQGENRPELALAYLAVLDAGAVLVPMDAQLGETEVGEILATAGVTLAIASLRHLPLMRAVRDTRIPALRIVALEGSTEGPSLADALARFPAAEPRPLAGSPDDLAVLVFTSGTTGHAKGVMLSHANLLSNVEGVVQTFEFGAGDRFLSVLPLHHTFEFTGGLLCPMRAGASVAYARGLKSNELREDLSTSGATILLGVPLLYEKLLGALHRGIDEAPFARRWLVRALLAGSRIARVLTGARPGRAWLRSVRERAGLDTLRLFVSGAAPLPSELFWAYTDFGWPVLEGYGLTECSPVVAANRPHRPRPGAVGWPLVGVEVRIADPDAEGNGEITVRGPNVMLGYYGNPAATRDVLHDGWFATGDLGRFTDDGRVRITGRLKNMIATAAGKKIYPEEVEAQLAGSPYIAEIVVVGGRDARTGREEVHAHVVPNLSALEALAGTSHVAFDDAFVERVLRREIDGRSQHLAPYKHVKRVIVRREEFPKTTTGKIRRHGLGGDADAPRASAVA
jgi:long-chain acyl-CoA synthetase